MAAKPLGRYNYENVRDPAGGIAPQPPSDAVRRRIGLPEDTEVIAAPDPWDASGKGRLLARSRKDILGDELSKERISLEAFNAGRLVEAVFERAQGRVGGSSWMEGSRVDASTASEIAVIRKLDNARKTLSYIDAMRRVLGHVDTHIVREFLGDRLSADQVAARRGRTGERAANYYLERLRDALKALVDSGWGGVKGKEKSTIRSTVA